MAEKIEVGGIYEGKVLKLKPFGAIVSLDENSQGLVHISHIANSYVQNVSDHLVVGDVVNVKVLSNDPATGKIALSIKDAPQPAGSSNSENVRPEQEYRPRSFHDGGGSSYGGSTFEEKFKDWVKSSNERQAGLNKRNKRR